MKKRISFIIIILILISAFMISASADYINTFQFIQNIGFSTQTNFTGDTSTTFQLQSFSTDTYRINVPVNSSGSLSYGFLAYGIKLVGTGISDYVELKLPFAVNLPSGSSLKLPFIYCTNLNTSITNSLYDSYFTMQGVNYKFDFSVNSSVPSQGYINNLYTNQFTVIDGDFAFDRCQYLYLNLANTTDKDLYVNSITLRFNRLWGNVRQEILFPFIYEGDELVSYTPPNPYNIPILQDINSTLDMIISKLVSGDNSVGDLLSDVLSLVESLDTNIGAIDTNILQIVNQLNYLASLDSSNASINSTLIDIRRTLHDLAVGTQYLPSDSFTQDINNNQQYINTEQATTVNRYNNANEEKNNIYTSSSSGLTSSGGTYDFVGDLVADAGSDQAFNGIFGLIFGDSNISGIILTVIALGTISYILYGKRG